MISIVYIPDVILSRFLRYLTAAAAYDRAEAQLCIRDYRLMMKSFNIQIPIFLFIYYVIA